MPVPVPVPGKASNVKAGGADWSAWSSITNDSTYTTWRSTSWSWPTASSRRFHGGEAIWPTNSHAHRRPSCSTFRRVRGKLSKPDKRRYYLTARGSATESAALLDVCYRLELIDPVRHQAGKDMVVRIVSMLVKLAQACEE